MIRRALQGTSIGVAGAVPLGRAAESGVAAAPPQLFSAAYIAQVLGSLALVFIGLFLVVWLLRRVNRLGGGVAGGALKVIASASVGQRERVVLVEVGDEQLLLGVAPGSVRALHTLERPVASAHTAAAAAPPDFAAALSAVLPVGGRRS